MATKKTDRSKRRASNVLSAFNILFLVVSIVIIAKIVYIQYIWEPDRKYISYFQPSKRKQVIEPERGSIIDHNGKLLAMSTPMYDIYMDCKMMKDVYAGYKDRKEGWDAEQKWRREAGELAKKLPEVLSDRKMKAADYEELIISARDAEKGGKFVPIVKGIDHGTLLQLKRLPLFNEKRQYQNCLIVKKNETRQYPYGELAKRVIGYVRHNNDTNSRHIGIEGKYDYVLHGKKGEEWKRVTDKNVMITDVERKVVDAENGHDVRTTLDINMQDIADRILRKNIAKDTDITGGCVVILDVETGAIRSMVNLQKTKKGDMREVFNMAAGTASEPGSVFKAVTLMTLLEDRCAKLGTEIPSNHGVMKEFAREYDPDPYVLNYERETGRSMISVQEGFKRSSNYVFRRFVYDNYKDRPEEYINRLHQYNFGDAYEFDLSERGSARPSIPDPDRKGWAITDLMSVAIGYAVRVTPLQTVTFYNAIANKGKMMKPYIVESIEDNGKVITEFKPAILNGSICSRATADSLTKALTVVTTTGTAKTLKNAKCTIAGKTGTARIHLMPHEKPKKGDAYVSETGQRKHQATFVGFFPAEKPKYSAIVVLYTDLISHNVYGGSLPASTFKEIADELWAYETEWGTELKGRGEVPQMTAEYIGTSKSADMPVPDMKGLGLSDVLYAIENNGYRCRHTGTGHVVSQSPEAGTKLKKGQTISIVLK